MQHVAGFAVMALHVSVRGLRRRVLRVACVRAMWQTAVAVAAVNSRGEAARHQRPGRGEQCQNGEDGVRASHGSVRLARNRKGVLELALASSANCVAQPRPLESALRRGQIAFDKGSR